MDQQEACIPVGECRKLLVELQALRLRATALEEVVAGYVSAVEGGSARRGQRCRCRRMGTPACHGALGAPLAARSR
ncbi:MAG: hypothetical protein H0V23_09655 [Nocardioidaceae bacterium]|nr:hypothetical protein [Nocardioidaceae bacterium]